MTRFIAQVNAIVSRQDQFLSELLGAACANDIFVFSDAPLRPTLQTHRPPAIVTAVSVYANVQCRVMSLFWDMQSNWKVPLKTKSSRYERKRQILSGQVLSNRAWENSLQLVRFDRTHKYLFIELNSTNKVPFGINWCLTSGFVLNFWIQLFGIIFEGNKCLFVVDNMFVLFEHVSISSQTLDPTW